MSYGTRVSASSSPFDPSSIITHNCQMEEPSLNAAWGIPYRFFLCNQIKNDSLLVKYTPIKCQFHALSFFFYCQSLWNPAASLPQLHHKQFSCFPLSPIYTNPNTVKSSHGSTDYNMNIFVQLIKRLSCPQMLLLSFSSRWGLCTKENHIVYQHQSFTTSTQPDGRKRTINARHQSKRPCSGKPQGDERSRCYVI